MMAQHVCSDCQKSFPKPWGLSVHRNKMHRLMTKAQIRERARQVRRPPHAAPASNAHCPECGAPVKLVMRLDPQAKA